MATQSLKVGELARRTGVSVRTLHHYHAIGLLSPGHRTAKGHRLYGEADVQRLFRIRSLVQIGFSLDEVAACLQRPDFSPERALALHLERLRARIAAAERLCQRLESLSARLGEEGSVSVGEFLETIEAMTMLDKYYSEAQLEKLHGRRQELGDEAIRAVEAEWPQLIARVRAEMDKGTDPKDPAVQALARRWKELLAVFTGGDPEIAKAAGRMITAEPSVRERTGLDAAILTYVGRAMAP
ncbi:MAG: MerR family transcriptional regulator [Planctomycetota bacterium]